MRRCIGLLFAFCLLTIVSISCFASSVPSISDLEDMSIKEIKALRSAIVTISKGGEVDPEYFYLKEKSVKELKELYSAINDTLGDGTKNTEKESEKETSSVKPEDYDSSFYNDIMMYLKVFKDQSGDPDAFKINEIRYYSNPIDEDNMSSFDDYGDFLLVEMQGVNSAGKLVYDHVFMHMTYGVLLDYYYEGDENQYLNYIQNKNKYFDHADVDEIAFLDVDYINNNIDEINIEEYLDRQEESEVLIQSETEAQSEEKDKKSDSITIEELASEEPYASAISMYETMMNTGDVNAINSILCMRFETQETVGKKVYEYWITYKDDFGTHEWNVDFIDQQFHTLYTDYSEGTDAIFFETFQHYFKDAEYKDYVYELDVDFIKEYVDGKEIDTIPEKPNIKVYVIE